MVEERRYRLLTAQVGLARYLNQPIRRYEPFAVTRLEQLAAVLQPADVLLVEGNRRISTAIKYLTQSTWSHAAVYVGDFEHSNQGIKARVLIEADVRHGVRAVPLTTHGGLNVRICRPVGLSREDCARVCRYAIERLGDAVIPFCRVLRHLREALASP